VEWNGITKLGVGLTQQTLHLMRSKPATWSYDLDQFRKPELRITLDQLSKQKLKIALEQFSKQELRIALEQLCRTYNKSGAITNQVKWTRSNCKPNTIAMEKSRV
jgi:hypothetical protein